MTRTEDRLTAALESAAAAVRVEAMRPLAAPEPGRPGQPGSPRRGVTGSAYRRRTWLVALTAAASIAVIAGVLVALNNQTSSRTAVAAAYIGGSEPAVPAFFVDAGSTGLYDGKLRVVSLATGAATATVHAPAGTQDITFLAEQAQTGNWVAAFASSQPGLVLYRFSITGTGKITPMTRIGRFMVRAQPEDLTVLALSPDGSRLALSQIRGTTATGDSDTGSAYNNLIVLNLKTGAQQVWKDNLAAGAYQPSITSAVWTPAGRALVFAAQMCKPPKPGGTDTGPCFWQFRSLRTPPAGDGFQAGPVLLRQNGAGGVDQAPAISPDGGSVVEVRNGADPTLARIGLVTGKQVVLHQLPAPGPYGVGANEGNFLIVAQITHSGDNAVIRGWIDGPGFHPVTYPRGS
jgi:hypothetical protein